MKIQHLAVIFIIIILPITIVFSAYIDSQIETITLENEYDTRLLDCTYDAIKAYQINTINNSESDVTNSKVADIEASINTFKNSLVTAFGYSGYDLSVMDAYLPAVVYCLYDGYYIYQPFENTLTETSVYDDSSLTDGEKIDGLKNYVYYSCRYKYGTSDFVITYTLDNAITVQGIVNGEYVNVSGYLIDGITKISDESYKYDGITFSKSNGENLKECVGTSTYNYVKMNGTKYYTNGTDMIFSIINGQKTAQITSDTNGYSYTQYKKKIENNESAYNYYKEAYEFTNWIRDNLWELSAKDAVNSSGDKITNFGDYKIFGKKYYGETSNLKYKYIQDEDSNFNQARRDVIKYTIETNLRTAIANFTKYSKESTEFAMPKISDSDWELIENNVTTISFLQGMKIKNKTYNGYAVVTNSLTKEYVDESAIYIETNDLQYHKVTDKDLLTDYTVNRSSGYLNIDYERKLISEGSENTYYYSRVNGSNCSNMYLGCYNSISGNSGVNNTSDIYKYMRNLPNTNQANALKKAYYTALARERESSFKIYNDEMLDILISYGDPLISDVAAVEEWVDLKYIEYGGPKHEIIKKGSNYTITNIKPTMTYLDTETGVRLEAKFTGWTTNKYSFEAKYKSNQVISNLKNSITLYPTWDITQYAIKYDSNLSEGDNIYSLNGMPNPLEQTAYCDGTNGITTITISDNLPTKKDKEGNEYICLGWSLDKNSEIVEYTSGDTFRYISSNPQKVYKLYAVWGKYTDLSKFKWKTDANQTINRTFKVGDKSIYPYLNLQDTDVSNTIYITGNTKLQGKGAIWCDLDNAENYYYMELTFDYKIDFGDSFYCAGVLLGVTESMLNNNDSLTAKAISFNHQGIMMGTSTLGTFWDINYAKNKNFNILYPR